MSISSEQFGRVLLGLQRLKQFGRELDESALMLAWLTFPEKAKQELTQDHLAYAAGQLLLDPDPPKETAVHLALLRYVYRLENGQPNLEWGLKADLDSRMKLPGKFHPPVPMHHARPAAEVLGQGNGYGVLEGVQL
jgi:hypothetical protein